MVDDNTLASTAPDNPNGYGTGGQYKEDARDFPISDLYSVMGLAAATVFPPTFKVPGAMPPVLNQGNTPQCVAYSGSTLRAYQDRIDQGKFFDFNESLFFTRIGGNSAGAFISNALSQVRSVGYPVVAVDQSAQHKISAYFAVPQTIADLKAALMDFGPLWCIGQWYNNWFSTLAGGVLRAPVGINSGHAVVLYGWDDSKGWLFRNSWGTGFGVGGDFYLPYAYTFASNGGYMWAAYRTVDVVEIPTLLFPGGKLYRLPVKAGSLTVGYSKAPSFRATFSAVYLTGVATNPWWKCGSGPYSGYYVPRGVLRP